MKIDLKGRRVLALGGKGAVGAAILAALADNGAVVDERSFGPAPGLDCASPEAATAAAEAYVRETGRPDLLVLVSDTAGFGDGATETGEERDWFLHATRAFAPFVGRVINVVSVAGLVPVRDAIGHSAHHAALVSLTRGLAMELGPDVLVNALAVGAVGEDGSRLVSHSPLKRSATAAEVGVAALFLADPRNTYTTGHVMAVDGGWSIGYARDF
jgi:NAD(P)-dependent dehydrogenase (short-subunit alcohol dehydrogenase family)